MLQKFRDNLKGKVAIGLVVLLAIPFALVGVESFFNTSGSANQVAEVNGEKITEIQLRRAIYLQQQQLRSRFGENLPESFLSDEQLREPVLNSLVQRQLLVQSAKESGMAIPDSVIDQQITGAPQFQVDGSFDPENYKRFLQALGYTPATYRNLLIEDFLLQQQRSGLVYSGFYTPKELERLTALTKQKRSFYSLTIPATSVEVTLKDEEIEAYYQENSEQFMAKEQVSVEYLEVKAEDIANDIEISDEDVRAQFDQELAAFEPKTERHAAHIMVEVKDDGSHTATLSEIQEKLSGGETFDALAKAYSDDLGSRDQGGDLGFSDGETFPPEFEEALAKLQPGQVSEPVETSDGFHFVKLISERGSEPPTFEQESDRIVRELKRAESEDRFVDVLDRIGELTYNAETLETAAEELGIAAKTSGMFSRNGAGGIFAQEKVLDAAFSDSVLKDGYASDVIELSETHVVVLKKIEHQPERIKELAEVREDVSDRLRRQKTRYLLNKQGQELEEKIQTGLSVEELAKEKDYEWLVGLEVLRDDASHDRELLAHVFQMPKPTDDKIETDGLQLSNGDFAIISLTKVLAGQLDSLSAEERKAMAAQLAMRQGAASIGAYEALLKASADITVDGKRL